MFGTLLTAFVILVLFAPGVVLAYRKNCLTPRFVLQCFLVNLTLFSLLGLLFHAMPWIIDPRNHL